MEERKKNLNEGSTEKKENNWKNLVFNLNHAELSR